MTFLFISQAENPGRQGAADRSQAGHEFDGIVTGASPKGTWARIFDPPVEGRIEQGSQGLDVGDRVRLKLIDTDPERGFIDIARAGHLETRQHR